LALQLSQVVGELPANTKARVPEAIASLQFTRRELDKFAETDIVPTLS
jgi:hypothetical protein